MTVNQFTRLDQLTVHTVGSNDFAAGRITMNNSAETITYGGIAPGFNTWRSGKFHTSAVDVGYICQWQFAAYNAIVRAELWVSNAGTFGVLTARALGIANNNTVDISFPIPIRVPPKGLITVRGIAKGPQSEAYTAFELYTRQE